jgi:hypothetical protein
MKVAAALVLYVLATTLGPVYMHQRLHDTFNWTQLALSFFCMLK